MLRIIILFITIICTLCSKAYTVTAQHITTADGLTSNVVEVIFQDPRGYIWFGCDHGLNRYDGYEVIPYHPQPGYKGRSTIGIEMSDDGSHLLIHHRKSETSQLRLADNTFGEMYKSDYEKNEQFVVIYNKDEVKYERTKGGGLKRTELTANGVKVREWKLLHQRDIPFTLRHQYHVAKLPDGNEIITTYGNGFFIYYPKDDKLEHHSSSDPERLIRTDYLGGLLVDSSGAVWISERWLGVTCLRFADVSLHRIPLLKHGSQEDNNVRAVLALSDDEVMASDNMGYVYRMTLSTGESRKVAYYDSRVYSMMLDNDRRLWTGTRGGGLYLDGNLVQGSEGMDVYQIKQVKPGEVWIAVLDQGLYKVSLGKNGEWSVGKATVEGDVRRIAIGKDGKVQPEPFTPAILTWETDRYGNIWQATQSGLLCKYKGGGEYTVMTAPDGLANVYNENASAQTPGGLLLFGSHAGLVVVKPEQRTEREQVGKVVITNHLTSSLSLPHDSNTVTMQFSTLHYSTLPATQFEYQMEGLDTVWRRPESPNSVTYQGLQPGQYVFRVRNMAGGGMAEMQVEIRQPWWNTWLAWSIYILLTAGILGAAVYFVVRISRLRNSLQMEQRMADFRNDFYRKVLKEIRNPLNVVEGTSQNLTSSDSLKSNAQNLRRSSRRLMRIFQSMEEFYSADLQSDLEKKNEEAESAFSDIQQEIHAEEQTVREMAAPPANMQRLLIVERDAENAVYLEQLLNPYFKTEVRDSMGDMADDNALRQWALIIMAVDGQSDAYEQTQTLRKKCGVAVVHLVGDGSDAQRLRSTKSGAAACMSKPYNGKLLVQTVLNIVKMQVEWQEKREKKAQPTVVLENSGDRRWQERLLATVDHHLSEPTFSVEALGEAMNLGRTQLNKKVKETTGLTPVQLIKQKRLERAAELLLHTDSTIETVMQQCGMNSINLFYADFKKQFGCTPKQYRKG